MTALAGFALLAAALVALPATAANAATLSETEPNNTSATANALPIGSTIVGSIYGTSWNDYDYYSFTVGSTSKLNLKLTYPGGLGTGEVYSFELLDSAGNVRYDRVLDGGDSSSAWSGANAIYLAPGTYYVELYGSNSMGSWGKSYSLSVNLTAGAYETESNDTSSKADALTLGKTITGSTLSANSNDYDYYRFTVESASKLNLKLTYPSGLGTNEVYSFELLDSSGSVRYDRTLDGGDSSSAWSADNAMYLGAGTYYVDLYGASSMASWGKSYSLTVNLTPGAYETEPNDSSSTSDTLTLGKPLTGSAFRASYQDDDYYSFTVPSGKHSIALKVGLANGLGTDTAYYVVLTDAEGDGVGDWEINGNGVGAPPVLTLKGGLYYLSILGEESSASWGKPYTVSVGQIISPAPVPTISGAAELGHTVTAKAGTWGPAPVALSYQWLRNGSAISGATKSTYTLVAADAHKRISVRVTGSKSGFVSVAKTSAQTAAVKLPVTRLAGADRYATAVATSKREFPSGTKTVFLASGLNYPDALAAAPAAAKTHAALLLTAPDALPSAVATELKRLKPATVYLIGGTGAISSRVATQVKAATGVSAQRIYGTDRFGTSAAIAAKFFPSAGTVFVATGLGFPDALSGAAAAASKGAPVLLVPGTSSAPTSAVSTQLKRLHPTTMYVIGGTGVVSSAMLTKLGKAVRLAGSDRYATSIAVSSKFYATSKTAVIANGLNFPDALVGSVLAGTDKAPLYLSTAACLPAPIASDIGRVKATSLTLMGGTGVLGSGVADETSCR